MKMTLEWHKERLPRWEDAVERAARAVHRAEEEYDRARASYDLLVHQIAEAERQGKDGFDPDKFCVPRKSR